MLSWYKRTYLGLLTTVQLALTTKRIKSQNYVFCHIFELKINHPKAKIENESNIAIGDPLAHSAHYSRSLILETLAKSGFIFGKKVFYITKSEGKLMYTKVLAIKHIFC